MFQLSAIMSDAVFLELTSLSAQMAIPSFEDTADN